jgi:NAD-dependent dihydropyrimidine dehydrogenase PreA subunit
MWEVVVDKDKCSGDEECVDACPAQVVRPVLKFARKVLSL